jgi:hypothetical protein
VTHERELTEPVDLCTPDGAALNPDALGWSRHPLHRANLHGRWGINKQWDYWAVLAGDLIVSCVYSDVDHIGLADVYWADLVTGESGGHGIVVATADGMSLPEVPGTAPLRVDRDGLDLELVDDDEGTHLRAAWTEPDGRAGRFDITVFLPAGHESLNVVIPWGDDDRFNFTSKHQARPAQGELVVGDRRRVFGAAEGVEAWGVLDVGRGRWPAAITWNWGGGAGRVGDHVVGIQIGGKWTEGSGFTENGVILDGRLTKLGRELVWDYDWDHPLEPWHVDDPGGQLHLVLTPRFDKYTDVGDENLGSVVHQVFGRWSGNLTTDDGVTIEFDDLQGFAEEARQHW